MHSGATAFAMISDNTPVAMLWVLKRAADHPLGSGSRLESPLREILRMRLRMGFSPSLATACRTERIGKVREYHAVFARANTLPVVNGSLSIQPATSLSDVFSPGLVRVA